MEAGATLFLFGSDFEKKESGPDISARPAYIRGANDRIRTGDLLITNQMHYRLCYSSMRLKTPLQYSTSSTKCKVKFYFSREKPSPMTSRTSERITKAFGSISCTRSFRYVISRFDMML